MEPQRGGRPHLSIVVPAYNEERRLAATLDAIRRYLGQQQLDAELIVVDDGSQDATIGEAERALAGTRGRVLRQGENRGKGAAVRRGVLEAQGRWVLMTDADLSTPIEEYARLADAAREHDLDIAIGSRAAAGAVIEVHQSRLRETLGKTFNVIVRGATRLPYRDTQCGFKLFDRRRVLPLFEKMVVDRFAFDAELLFLATRFGLRVGEIPVVWRDSAPTSVLLLRDPLNMLVDLARVRWRFRRGLYNPDPVASGSAPEKSP